MRKLQTDLALATVQASGAKPMTVRVSKRGGVSLYGIMRFPVTLSPAQWGKVSELLPRILDYCATNAQSIQTQTDYAKKQLDMLKSRGVDITKPAATDQIAYIPTLADTKSTDASSKDGGLLTAIG